MARITLYVPDELKARMDAASEGMNWSEIARPCIEAALDSEKQSSHETGKRPRPVADLSRSFVVIDGNKHELIDLLRPLTTVRTIGIPK